MKKRLTIGAATTAVLALIAAGIYQQSSLAQVFAQFALDTNPVNQPVYFVTADGNPAIMFEDESGFAAYWERHTPGKPPTPSEATMFVDGVPFTFNADGTIGGESLTTDSLEVYAQPGAGLFRAFVTAPKWVKVNGQSRQFTDLSGDAQTRSSDFYIYFDDCDTAAVAGLWVPSRMEPSYPRAEYHVEVQARNDSGEWYIVDKCILLENTYQNVIYQPGLHRVYFYPVDSLGNRGPRVGPIEFSSGDPCPPVGG